MSSMQKGMHISVGVLFLIAMILYVLGGTSDALVLGGLGAAIEIVAWIALFVSTSKTEDSK